MRAVQVYSPGDIKVIEVEEPAVCSGYALIKPEMVTICGSDLRQVYCLPEKTYPLQPGVSGHEIVGVIEKIVYPENFHDADSENPPLNVGNRVLALLPEIENAIG